jgi:hypothetical protein
MDDEFKNKISIDNSDYGKMVSNLGPDCLHRKYGGKIDDNIKFGKQSAKLVDQYKSFLDGQ